MSKNPLNNINVVVIFCLYFSYWQCFWTLLVSLFLWYWGSDPEPCVSEPCKHSTVCLTLGLLISLVSLIWPRQGLNLWPHAPPQLICLRVLKPASSLKSQLFERLRQEDCRVFLATEWVQRWTEQTLNWHRERAKNGVWLSGELFYLHIGSSVESAVLKRKKNLHF